MNHNIYTSEKDLKLVSRRDRDLVSKELYATWVGKWPLYLQILLLHLPFVCCLDIARMQMSTSDSFPQSQGNSIGGSIQRQQKKISGCFLEGIGDLVSKRNAVLRRR